MQRPKRSSADRPLNAPARSAAPGLAMQVRMFQIGEVHRAAGVPRI
jgi:hypothetical protein